MEMTMTIMSMEVEAVAHGRHPVEMQLKMVNVLRS